MSPSPSPSLVVVSCRCQWGELSQAQATWASCRSGALGLSPGPLWGEALAEVPERAKGQGLSERLCCRLACQRCHGLQQPVSTASRWVRGGSPLAGALGTPTAQRLTALRSGIGWA